MKNPALLPFLAAFIFFLPAAAAADEPEAVYARYHRAAMAGDLDEMLKYAPAQKRAEMQGLSEASREAALKLVQFMMPRAFRLANKSVGRNGRATLKWKVAESNWSDEKPALLTAQPAAAPFQAEQSVTSTKGAQAVGSAPGRKLGEARQECVYKPVMTAEDMDRCK